MQQVANIKPTVSPTSKPFLPWTALGTAAILIALLLGASNRYLTRFQKPYSFEAQSEPTIEIVDAPIILDIAAKPAVRNQAGQDTSETNRAGTQVSNVISISVGPENAAQFSTVQWMPRANMPTARFNFATCVVDGKVFAIGGEVDKFGDRAIATVEMYDPKTDTWERKTDMPTARSGMSTLVVDGKIYAIGGAKVKKHQAGPGWGYSGKLLPTIEMYDPGTDTWTRKADMPVPRSGSACVVDGKIYIIGGSAADRKQWRLDNVDVYDPATDTWAEVKSMNHARGVPAVSVVNGKIYVMGGGFRGNGPYTYLSTVENYDPETDRWTQKPDMPIGRSGHKAEVIDGNIYIFGDSSAGIWTPLTTVDVYSTGEVPGSVNLTRNLVQTWETIKNSNR